MLRCVKGSLPFAQPTHKSSCHVVWVALLVTGRHLFVISRGTEWFKDISDIRTKHEAVPTVVTQGSPSKKFHLKVPMHFRKPLSLYYILLKPIFCILFWGLKYLTSQTPFFESGNLYFKDELGKQPKT